ncbi:hypothetical protein F5Y16DRAFT_421219 [Xylariaceae sp. FL0255]|nr:hypothetical protein F5Y16DRAFT_421219 [Xylariaceae sp. FL0255]
MDPYTALGSAASILQIIDLGRSVGAQMIKTLKGAMNEYDSYENTTADLGVAARILEDKMKPKDSGQNTDGEAIRKISEDCHGIVERLMGMLEDVKPSKREKSHLGFKVVAEHLIKAVKKTWNEDEIERMMNTLDKCRNQLILRVVMSLETKSDAIIDQGTEIQQNISNIVEVTAIFQERQQSSSVEQTNKILGRIDESNDRLKTYKDETIAAILKMADGSTRFISPDPHTAQSAVVLGQERVAMQWTVPQFSTHPQVNTNYFTDKDTRRVDALILESLYFRQISDRWETVKDPHETTYEWIFCDPDICGKAGSGKSTLMKYIYKDQRTLDFLNRWAQHGLKTASFFFYGHGNPLQKSQKGLLRSLLYEILSNDRDLIYSVMTELFPIAARLASDGSLSEPSLPELLKWFQKLVSINQEMRYFFLIDGIDEYDGNTATITELIDSMAELPNAKFLISSRPISGCVERFSKFPHLKLQDLTRDDIRQYAKDRLGSRLRGKGSSWTSLIDQITERSSGVFLWVVVSIKSLLEGLENRDNIKELQNRLNDLPSDLADLYAHILGKMSPTYQKQAAQLFQIVLESKIVQEERYWCLPLTTLQVSFIEDDASDTIKLPVVSMSEEEVMARCDEAEGRVRSRCCGLVETRSPKPNEDHDESIFRHERPCVDFLHRTVVEFLEDTTVIEKLTKWRDPTFTPLESLFHSCARMCKSFPMEKVETDCVNPVWHFARFAIKYLSRMEISNRRIDASYLNDLDGTMQKQWEKHPKKLVEDYEGRPLDGRWASSFSVSGGSNGLYESSAMSAWRFETPISFLSLSTVYGLPQIIEHELGTESSPLAQSKSEKSLQLLFAVSCLYVIYLRHHPSESPVAHSRLPAMFKIWKILIQAGADPNESARVGHSSTRVWRLILNELKTYIEYRPAYFTDFETGGFSYYITKLIMLLIEGGADVHVDMERYIDKRPACQNVMGILQDYFNAGRGPPNELGSLGVSTSKKSNFMSGKLEWYYQCTMQMLRERGAPAAKTWNISEDEFRRRRAIEEVEEVQEADVPQKTSRRRTLPSPTIQLVTLWLRTFQQRNLLRRT